MFARIDDVLENSAIAEQVVLRLALDASSLLVVLAQARGSPIDELIGIVRDMRREAER